MIDSAKFAVAVVVAAFFAFTGYRFGLGEGRRQKADEEYRAMKEQIENSCLCGAVQTCVFGPGIVGEQKCRTTADFFNHWGRCEPAL